MADFEDLDWAFTCPATVTDQDLKDGYEVLVARFRVEGAHLPLNTAFQLQIERVIDGYIKHKQAARKKYGTAAGYANAKEESDANRLVMAGLHEVSDTLRRNVPNADKELLMAQWREATITVLRGIPDTAIRDDMARRFASAYERIGY